MAKKRVKVTKNSKNWLYKSLKLSTKNLITLETSITRFPNLQLQFNINITTLQGSLVYKKGQKQPKIAQNNQNDQK